MPLQVSVKRNGWNKAWVHPLFWRQGSWPPKVWPAPKSGPPCEATLLTARFTVFLQLQWPQNVGGLSRNTLPEWHRWQNGENIPYLQTPFLQRLQPRLWCSTTGTEHTCHVQQDHQTYMSPRQFSHLPWRGQMLHHRLGLHKGRRYWVGPPTSIMAKLSATYTATPNIYTSDTTTPSTPIPLQRIPSWARPGVTIISSTATMHATPPFYHTSALLEPSQAFYMPATVFSTPHSSCSSCAPAVQGPPQYHLCLVSQAAWQTIPTRDLSVSALLNQVWFTFPEQVSPSGKHVRLQRPHFFTCCCFSCALHPTNSNTCFLRSHVKAFAKSSSEHDRRPGLQKVLPCPDQQQDAVCWFPTGHHRQLFSECKSSKCYGWERASSYQVPRLYSLRRALPCLP